MRSTKTPPLLSLLAVLLFSLKAFAQPCPGFQNGNPGNHLQTVTFYDNHGNPIGDCECQLTGNAFKCGSCLPSKFTAYQYVSGGITVNCINAAVLPVELLRFEALVTDGRVQLSWITETERDNEKFIVERSPDGIVFEPLLEVKGAINSVFKQSYTASDNDPISGVSYYRLSQADVNGKVTQIGLVTVEANTTLTGIMLVPNPANGSSVLQLPLHAGMQEFQVVVSNYSGTIVREQTVTEAVVLDLPAGFYQVTVFSGAQRWSEKLVIIQN